LIKAIDKVKNMVTKTNKIQTATIHRLDFTQPRQGIVKTWQVVKPSTPPVIYAELPAVLHNPRFYRQLWLFAIQAQVPRREWLNVISLDLLQFKGQIFYRTGEPFPMPYIDDVFGEDLDARWFSEFLKADRSGESPKTISRKSARLRLIALSLCARSELVRHKLDAIYTSDLKNAA
jgi:hypothetical protein